MKTHKIQEMSCLDEIDRSTVIYSRSATGKSYIGEFGIHRRRTKSSPVDLIWQLHARTLTEGGIMLWKQLIV